MIFYFFSSGVDTRVEDYSKLSRDVWKWKGSLCIPVSFRRWSYFRRSPELGGTSSFAPDPSPRRLNLLRNRLFALRCWKTGSKSEPLNTCYQLSSPRASIIAGFKSRAKVHMIEKSRFVSRKLNMYIHFRVTHLLNGLIGFGCYRLSTSYMLCSFFWRKFGRLVMWWMQTTLTKWQVPILDGSAKEWVGAIEEVGVNVARNHVGESVEKMVAHLNKPVHVCKNDSFVAAFPAVETRVTCGIDFPQVQSTNNHFENAEDERLTVSCLWIDWFMMSFTYRCLL